MFKFCNIQPWYHQQSRSMPGRRAWFGSVSCRRLGGPENLPHLWSETPWSIGIEMQMPIIAVFWYLRNAYCYKLPGGLFTQSHEKDPQAESFQLERIALHPLSVLSERILLLVWQFPHHLNFSYLECCLLNIQRLIYPNWCLWGARSQNQTKQWSFLLNIPSHPNKHTYLRITLLLLLWSWKKRFFAKVKT